MPNKKIKQLVARCKTARDLKNYERLHILQKKWNKGYGETLQNIVEIGLNEIFKKDLDIKKLQEYFKDFIVSVQSEIDGLDKIYMEEKHNKKQYLKEYLNERYPNTTKRNIVYLKLLKHHFINELYLFNDIIFDEFLYQEPSSSYVWFFAKKNSIPLATHDEWYNLGIKIRQEMLKRWYNELKIKGIFVGNNDFNLEKVMDLVLDIYKDKKGKRESYYEKYKDQLEIFNLPGKKSIEDITKIREGQYKKRIEKEQVEKEKNSDKYYYLEFLEELNSLFKTYFPNFNEAYNKAENIYDFKNLQQLNLTLSHIFKESLDLKGFSKYLIENEDPDSPYFNTLVNRKEKINYFRRNEYHIPPIHLLLNIVSFLGRYDFNMRFLFNLFNLDKEMFIPQCEININEYSDEDINYLLSHLQTIKKNSIYCNDNIGLTISLEEFNKKHENKIITFEDLYKSPIFLLIEFIKKIYKIDNPSRKESYFIKEFLRILDLRSEEIDKLSNSELYNIIEKSTKEILEINRLKSLLKENDARTNLGEKMVINKYLKEKEKIIKNKRDNKKNKI